jgi:hypothetical protein
MLTKRWLAEWLFLNRAHSLRQISVLCGLLVRMWKRAVTANVNAVAENLAAESEISISLRENMSSSGNYVF